ncbi:hypothetical protein BY458DRAFT_509789 [Sporodiniella umbellata]|nr:hypothetical protein BY458DRAFT_509789 [Sporodiniella umbellata]
MTDSVQIYKATYSGVPVYEMNCRETAVMKRRKDSYLNATQILKVAEFDKPQRTRILEREVQTGCHEKVQGGYGKYQGTWVPFERGVALAEQYKVHLLLKPIFDFIQGDISPPLAPKHTFTTKPKIPKVPKTTESKKKKTKKLKLDPETGGQIDEDKSVDQESRMVKRKQPFPFGLEDGQQPTYAQQLLQYFISDEPGVPMILVNPPTDLDVNIIIDDEGHTSLHWAAAMGRLNLVNILVDLGADIYRVNYKGQTALMRSVLFTNNFDSKSFLFLINMLKKTMFNIDKKDQTVFHHVASTASWKGKVHASRYYMECLIETLEHNNIAELISILNVQDIYGDTALNISARIGNKKLVRLLIEAGASAEIVNEEGMAATDYMVETEKGNGTKSLLDLNRTETKERSALREKVEDLFKTIVVNEKPPVVSHMFDGFASNYERDLVQKDNLIKEKKNELVLTKKRLLGTQHTLEQIQFDSARMQKLEEESLRLSKVLTMQTHALQKEALEGLFCEEEIQQEQCDELLLDNLLSEYSGLKRLHKQRVQELVQLKLQTPSKRHQKYKRLISMCCNVSYENVDLMLLPLLSSFDELLSTPAEIEDSN